jgi:hypothetical protein
VRDDLQNRAGLTHAPIPPEAGLTNQVRCGIA